MTTPATSYVCAQCQLEVPEQNKILHSIRCKGTRSTIQEAPDKEKPALSLADNQVTVSPDEHESTEEIAQTPTDVLLSDSNYDSYWVCAACSLRNTDSVCDACGTIKGSTQRPQSTSRFWNCTLCTLANSSSLSYCNACGSARPADSSYKEQLISDDEGDVDDDGNTSVDEQTDRMYGVLSRSSGKARDSTITAFETMYAMSASLGLLLGLGLGLSTSGSNRQQVMFVSLASTGCGALFALLVHSSYILTKRFY